MRFGREPPVAEPNKPSAPWPGREHVPPHTRAWFIFFVAWMAGWAALALWALERSSAGSDVALRVWLLALACFYLSLCNSLIPLPTAWIVLLAGAPEYALVPTPGLRVLFVGGLLGAATAVANLNEYHLAAYILRFGLGRRIRRTRLYGWAARWFDRSPFQILLLVALVPIPVDAVRWLAIVRGYARWRFGLAYFVGRGARYVLLALCSTALALGPRAIVLLQVALVVGALLLRLAWRMGQRRSLSPSGQQQDRQRSDQRGDGDHADQLAGAGR